MEYPKAAAQDRDEYRVNERERKIHEFLKRFFRNVTIYIASAADYILFGKSNVIGTDPFQFKGSVQISENSATLVPFLNLVRSNGTATAPASTSSGDVVGQVIGTGYGGTTYYSGATIVFLAGENWSATLGGEYIGFFTTPNGGKVIQLSGYIAPSGSWASGIGSVATNATSGFLYIPTCAGVPTGTPETIGGRAAVVIDGTNNKMYIYSGGAWVALN